MKKFYLLGLASAALVAGIYVQGCGSSGGTDGGGPFTACTTDANCPTGQLCNTAGGVCMQKCSAGSDCPDSAKTCDKLATTSDKVCQCSTDALCGGGSAYCNSLDKTCETKCSDNSGCTGYNSARTCQSGSCLPGATTDGGTDGGAGCDATHPCTTGNYCNTAGQCTAGASNCTTPETQDVCNYGEACFTDATVSAQPVCEAVTQCSTAFNTNTTASHSPVVFDVVSNGTAADTQGACSTGTVETWTGHFYDPDGDVSSTSTYSHIYYVTASSVPGGGTGGNTYFSTSIDPTAGTFTFQLCTDLSASAAGVYIVDSAGNLSNSACIAF